jgi:hypothetical protein
VTPAPAGFTNCLQGRDNSPRRAPHTRAIGSILTTARRSEGMAKTAGWTLGLGVVMLGLTLVIGGCADSMSGGPGMTDKGMQPATNKSMMGSDQGMAKDGSMQGNQGSMDKK